MSTANILLKRKLLYLAILVINVGMVALLLFLVHHEKKAYLQLQKEGCLMFMESLNHNLEYSLRAEREFRKLFADRLLTVGRGIIAAERPSEMHAQKLAELCARYGIFRMVLVDGSGKARAMSRGRMGAHLREMFAPVYTGEKAELVSGLRRNMWGTRFRFIAGIHIPDFGALILIDEGEDLARLFSQISFHHVFENLKEYEGLEYLVFENEEGRLYSWPEHAVTSPWKKEFTENETHMVVGSGLLEVQEAIFFDGTFAGVLSTGFSLSFIDILQGDFRKLMLATIVFLLFLNGLFTYSLRLSGRLEREGLKFKAVLEGIEDGVLIRNRSGEIFRNAELARLVPPDRLDEILADARSLTRRELDHKTLLILKNTLSFADIFIVRDITLDEISRETREREKRLFSMGKLTASFAHEVRNPLNTISMIFQQLSPKKADPEEKQLLDLVGSEIQRLDHIVREFISIAKIPELRKTRVKPAAMIEDLVLFYRARTTESGISLVSGTEDPDLEAVFDKEKIRGVLLNLIENSLAAEAKTIHLAAKRNGAQVVLAVSDDGAGMTQEVSEKAFELYFTTRPKGSGLGLPHVQRIMTAHNGFVKMETRPDLGTAVYLYFPEGTDELPDPGRR